MIYLASNSPRRRQLMQLGGWPFTVIAAPVDESLLAGEAPAEYVRRLAHAKALAARPYLPSAAAPDDLIVAADTTVAAPLEAGSYEILGKPLDAPDAVRMLRHLRGRGHQVLTGIAVLRVGDGALRSDVAVSEVYMRAYSEAEIDAYVAGGDPLDKAGAYAIQHVGFHPVERVQGCYPNVVGLPVCRLSALLLELGAPAGHARLAACDAAHDTPCLLAEELLRNA